MKRVVFLHFFIVLSLISFAQPVGKNAYWVELKDKNFSSYSLSNPIQFLSQRSIDRRNRQNLPLNETDLPVSPAYLDSFRNMGAKIWFTSKWLNAVTVSSDDTLFATKLQNLSFVKNTEVIFRLSMDTMQTRISNTETDVTYSDLEYGESYGQISIHNGQKLHDKGYKGKGMIIAVLDAGYFRVDTMIAFKELRSRKGIIHAYDVVRKDDSVYNRSNHGMYVLSVMAAVIPDKLIGTAPEADYILLRTEVTGSESPFEEASWIAGVEFADSAGVDVLNTSLGYSQFDSSVFNHTYQDMDGQSTIASRVASMIASKGMILVNSAGNEGDDPWKFITAPADGHDILTVGAIDINGNVMNFSSRGPTWDGRVKPDVVAVGYKTIAATPDTPFTTYTNGTSLSAPVISGLVTCLWQEFPHKTSFDIMNAVRRSSHLYAFPNFNAGYGIPNFETAEQILKMQDGQKENFLLQLYPNPFYDHLTFSFFTANSENVTVSLYDVAGRNILEFQFSSEAGNLNKKSIFTPKLLPQGVYFLSLKTLSGIVVKKIIRD